VIDEKEPGSDAGTEPTGDPQDQQERGRREERVRRRARPQRVFDSSVPSPCIAVCQVDPASNLCIGCRRHVDEIRDWPIMTAEQKLAVLAALAARR
jgi:predicted Fe-S protein YdhL (DUF1289 family)